MLQVRTSCPCLFTVRFVSMCCVKAWGGSQHRTSLHPPADSVCLGILRVRGEIPGKRTGRGVSVAEGKRLRWSERWTVHHRLLLRQWPPVHSGVETAAHRILDIFRAKAFTDQAQGALRSCRTFSPGHLPVHQSTAGMGTWTGHRRHSGHGGVSPGQRHGAAPAVELQDKYGSETWTFRISTSF